MGWRQGEAQLHRQQAIRDQSLDGPHKNAFIGKIEANTSLRMEDIKIHQYFMTSNKSLIAWIQMDAHIIERITRETSRVPAKVFKTVPFIPELARGRKKAIDAVLLDYKRNVDNSLRYLIKNDTDDVKVLLKRYSEYDYLPYREIELKHLGKLPGFNTITKDTNVNLDLVEQVENPEQFRVARKRKQRNSPKKLSRNQINKNISKFLDGFKLKDSESEEESDTENEQEMVPDTPERESSETTESAPVTQVSNERVQTNL